MKKNHKQLFFTSTVALIFAIPAYSEAPGNYFNLKQWKLTLPVDKDRDDRVDEISTKRLKKYSHPNYFYLNANKHLVFASPNRGYSTPNSQNTRSELRQMIRGKNEKAKRNNFALKTNRSASKFGAIGGKLEATLTVDHVSLKAYNPEAQPAFSVVVGQVHAGKDIKLVVEKEGFGSGNEPLKIFYKKWPDHETGSVFWNYERNLSKYDPERKDISYPVWGYTWDKTENPGKNGIALGQEFSYTVNIYENTMHLSFKTDNRPEIKYAIDLSNNVNAYGEIDDKDNPKGYAQDWFYFKAGAYNQCNTSHEKGFWKPACRGTGDWGKDKKRGNYVQVTFSQLELGKSTKMVQELHNNNNEYAKNN